MYSRLNKPSQKQPRAEVLWGQVPACVSGCINGTLILPRVESQSSLSGSSRLATVSVWGGTTPKETNLQKLVIQEWSKICNSYFPRGGSTTHMSEVSV